MEVKKHRTNIEIVKDNWIKLQNLAALQNTSPTRIVNDLIDSYVNEKLPEDYQERIDERVNKVLDDKIDDFHFYTTHVKFGIGRATYDASQEIRSGDIERDEGISLVKQYDGEYPKRFSKDIFEYLSIREGEYGEVAKLFEAQEFTEEYFNNLVDFHSVDHCDLTLKKWIFSTPISRADPPGHEPFPSLHVGLCSPHKIS